MPRSTDVGPLSRLIENLAATHGSPAFTPHITLLSLRPDAMSEDPVSIKFKSAPFPISFHSIQAGQTYHQSVLAAITKDNIHLLDIYTKLKQAVEGITGQVPPTPPHFPHLSLLYGDLAMDAKAAIIRDLYSSASVVDVEGAGIQIAGMESCIINEVWLVRTEGKVEDWVTLAKHALPDGRVN